MSRDYVVAPGEFLREWIEDEGHGITQGALAERLGVSRKLVNEILNGKAPVTGDTAVRLERVTGISRRSWLRYEALYQEDRVRLLDEGELARHGEAISSEVGAYLRAHGATQKNQRDPGGLVADFLLYVRCGSFGAFEAVGQSLRSSCCVSTFAEPAGEREDGPRDLDPAALMAWVEVGERTDECAAGYGMTYRRKVLVAMVPRIKERAARPDASMLADVGAMLGSCGVVLVFVNPPKKFPLHGMTRWLSNGVPVIQISGLRMDDGLVTRALFHEIGHVLNDDRTVRDSSDTSKGQAVTDGEERAADAFATEALFGKEGLGPFERLERDEDIVTAAERAGVSPGVAVGEMRRRRMLGRGRGTKLLVNLVAEVH